MPESHNRQGLMLCAGAATILLVAMLAYEGVLDGFVRAVSDLVYDILRAVNRE